MTSDDRMTWGLIRDMFDVLERHGYRRHDKQHTAQAIGVIFDLASLYEGTRDAHYGPTSTLPRQPRTPSQDHPARKQTTRSSSPTPKPAPSSPRWR
jgi:hypothetical protein